ncbi:MAG: hypothetical protein AAB443_04610 [Patescibacteria group bacterium]
MMTSASNQKGQTLIFVILIMTIALAIGISISNRTVSTVKRTTNVDSSSRTLAAAEAGIESVLTRTVTDLNSSISGSATDCTSAYTTTYPATSGSADITTKASISIKRYGCLTTSAPNNKYVYDVEQDNVLELKFDHGASLIPNNINLNITWKYPNAATASSLYLMEISGSNMNNLEVFRKGYRAGSQANNFELVLNPSSTGFNYQTRTHPRVLRILSLYSPSTVTVTNNTAGVTLPYQGFEITSTGILGDSTLTGLGSKDLVRRSVVVKRSLPYLPAIFNFALYSQNGSLSK